jgi:hypothetical protein
MEMMMISVVTMRMITAIMVMAYNGNDDVDTAEN